MNVRVISPQALSQTSEPEGVASQLILERAVQALRAWQSQQDRERANRHGRCLEATRAALSAVDMQLPPPQPRPNNLATSNYKMLRQDPGRWGWEVAPSGVRYTLEYFDNVGRLPDGRIAGHIAIADQAAQVLYSSWDYQINSYWQANRIGSFVPAPSAAVKNIFPEGLPHDPEKGQKFGFPYLDAEVRDAASGTLLRRIPACALLASDGHTYLQADVLAEVSGVPLSLNDPHKEHLLVLRRARFSPS